ncbi:hypothetical protein NW752_006033 [Fusarium irregulare]|uniref:Uncharacterized protein n=1 Tax=Fusarium irregulare TaxID=2494466 RepID=A0A9W8PPJ9_9HYPO|nr:hypothetical protein NW766_006571 [Fusarium irregulare]KAJ4016959.1 hypothetical protein NW752_006033 [Fusarium irregulare]
MSESAKIKIMNEVIHRLWAEDPDTAQTLKRYISETDHIKDIMQAVVKDIGYTMNDLNLRGENAVALNCCKYDLLRAVDEHNSLTRDGYDRNFRPRLNCTVKSLKTVDAGKDGAFGGGSTQQDKEPMMEVTLRFPAREYNDSPHCLTSDKTHVYIMMKER